MKRPSYADALEYVLEHRARAIEAVVIVYPFRGAAERIAGLVHVKTIAALWQLEPLEVAENVLRLYQLRHREQNRAPWLEGK